MISIKILWYSLDKYTWIKQEDRDKEQDTGVGKGWDKQEQEKVGRYSHGQLRKGEVGTGVRRD